MSLNKLISNRLLRSPTDTPEFLQEWRSLQPHIHHYIDAHGLDIDLRAQCNPILDLSEDDCETYLQGMKNRFDQTAINRPRAVFTHVVGSTSALLRLSIESIATSDDPYTDHVMTSVLAFHAVGNRADTGNPYIICYKSFISIPSLPLNVPDVDMDDMDRVFDLWKTAGFDASAASPQILLSVLKIRNEDHFVAFALCPQDRTISVWDRRRWDMAACRVVSW